MTLDLFSRKVVAYRVSLKNSTYLIISTFQQAFQNRNAPQSLIFHSDQGAQYISKTLCKLLRINKLDQSFSAPSQPHDNAVMESSFSFMKREGIYRTQYSTAFYKVPYNMTVNFVESCREKKDAQTTTRLSALFGKYVAVEDVPLAILRA